MNIFLTSPDPVKCAVALDDKRVNKMAVETAQLLSTACHLRGVDIGYNMTHYRHPCSIWSRKTSGNFSWLVDHGIALCEEYTHRYGSRHASKTIIERARDNSHLFDSGKAAFDFDSSGFQIGDVFTNYQYCLTYKWLHMDRIAPRWRNRSRPLFFSEISAELA